MNLRLCHIIDHKLYTILCHIINQKYILYLELIVELRIFMKTSEIILRCSYLSFDSIEM